MLTYCKRNPGTRPSSTSSALPVQRLANHQTSQNYISKKEQKCSHINVTGFGLVWFFFLLLMVFVVFGFFHFFGACVNAKKDSKHETIFNCKIVHKRKVVSRV